MRLAAQDGHGFAGAMRMLARADIAPEGAADGADPDRSRVVAGVAKARPSVWQPSRAATNCLSLVGYRTYWIAASVG
jgi:hypothetical protein